MTLRLKDWLLRIRNQSHKKSKLRLYKNLHNKPNLNNMTIATEVITTDSTEITTTIAAMATEATTTTTEAETITKGGSLVNMSRKIVNNNKELVRKLKKAVTKKKSVSMTTSMRDATEEAVADTTEPTTIESAMSTEKVAIGKIGASTRGGTTATTSPETGRKIESLVRTIERVERKSTIRRTNQERSPSQ